jgi:hypothetical protein
VAVLCDGVAAAAAAAADNLAFFEIVKLGNIKRMPA